MTRSWAGCVSNSFKFNMAPSYSRSSINRLKDVKGKIMENLQETMAFPLKYIGGSGNFFPVNQSNDSSNPTCLTYYIILPIWSLTKFPSDHSADFWTKRCHRELVWFRSSSQSRSGRLESRVNLMGPLHRHGGSAIISHRARSIIQLPCWPVVLKIDCMTTVQIFSRCFNFLVYWLSHFLGAW